MTLALNDGGDRFTGGRLLPLLKLKEWNGYIGWAR
jgi:hypothetical protein